MQARAGTRYEVILSVTAILAIAIATAASPTYAAHVFSVTTTTDATDVAPGDGRCDADALQSGDQCTLRAAVMEANAVPGADTINLAAGATYELTLPSPDPAGPDAKVGDLDVTGGLTIAGSGPDPAVIAGGPGWSDRLIEVDFGATAGNLDLVLSGIKLTKGKTDGVGGALYFTDVGGTLSLTDTTVVGNAAGPSAGDDGGGAYVRANAFTVRGAVFDGNTAGGAGGGLHIHPPPAASAADLRNLTLLGNHAGTHGGGLAAIGPARVDARVIEARDNVAGESSNGAGGGLYLNATDAAFEDVAIIGNHSSSDGGGVSTDRSLQISRGVIRGNTTGDAHGGGISFTASVAALSLTGLAIEGNKSNDGGGLWVNAATLTVANVSISGNEVVPNAFGQVIPAWTGGAWVALSLTGSATLVNVTFTDNRGGISGSGSAVSPSAITFNGSPASTPLLRNVTIARNRAGTTALSRALQQRRAGRELADRGEHRGELPELRRRGLARRQPPAGNRIVRLCLRYRGARTADEGRRDDRRAARDQEPGDRPTARQLPGDRPGRDEQAEGRGSRRNPPLRHRRVRARPAAAVRRSADREYGLARPRAGRSGADVHAHCDQPADSGVDGRGSERRRDRHAARQPCLRLRHREPGLVLGYDHDLVPARHDRLGRVCDRRDQGHPDERCRPDEHGDGFLVDR